MSVTLTQRRPSAVSSEKKPLSGTVPAVQGFNTYGEEFEAPNYTIKEILDAIPAECYKRSAVRSLSYVARDLFFIVLVAYLAITYIPLVPWMSARVLAWGTYALINGLFGTGCWVLAHECGHGAFSDYRTLNDIVGWILHSALLVPYHSWRLSHSKHHKATGHMTRDMVFVPKTKQEFMTVRGITENAEDTPIVTLYYLVLQQLFGWIMYLTTNVTGQKYPTRSKWMTNHFVPTSPLYDRKDFLDIVISDIGIASMLTVLYLAGQRWGYGMVGVVYVLPWLWVNHWLVHITYLQHTDPRLPHYDADHWNFARGASATVDREFGFIGKHIFHDIIETHVLHHFVSRIPFYNARVGTEAIKKVMGKHYVRDDSNFVTSLYRVARACQFVEGDGLKMFRNINNVGTDKPVSASSAKLQ
jgi:omega-6 fatty acid desaturase (delta-12 desaturase)